MLEKHFTTGEVVNKQSLTEKGILRKRDVALKVLKNGTLTKKLELTVDACSAAALEVIKACGGAVNLIKGA